MDFLQEIRTLPDSQQQFRRMCLVFSQMLAEEGVGARPFGSRDLPFFCALDPQAQRTARLRLFGMIEVMQEVRNSGKELRDTPMFLGRVLSRLGWVAQPDIFQKIEEADVVSVHGLDQRFVFQNLRYFDYISLSVEQSFSSTLPGRYRRDPAVDAKLQYYVKEFASGRVHKTLDPGIPEYLSEEVDSEEKRKFFVKPKYFSPLLSNGEVQGVVSVSRFRIP